MSFFKYHSYFDSKAIINAVYKNGGNIIHVGQLDEAGIIFVLDQNGSQQWCNSYSEPSRTIAFKKVTPFANGYIVLGIENEKILCVSRIDENGDIVWYKSYPDIIVNDSLFVKNFFDSHFYVAYFDVEKQQSGVLFIRANGEFEQKKLITNVNNPDVVFEISGFDTFSELVLITGNESIKGQRLGVLIKTAVGLVGGESCYTSMYSGMPIVLNAPRYINNKIILTGRADSIPVLLHADEDFGLYYQVNRGASTRFAFGDDYFYVYNDRREIIHSDYNYNHDWSKRFEVSELFIDQIDGNSVIIHGIDNSVNYSGDVPEVIDNCRVSPLQVESPIPIEYKKEVAEHIFNDEPYKFEDVQINVSGISYDNEDVCDSGSVIDFNEFSGLQTPNFYLQAAGSTGADSTRGIHLRWAFGGVLGENHLPKGNIAATSYNFNKPNDFVKIYRTPYIKSVFKLDFLIPPQLIDDNQKLWVYKFNNNARLIYVYFKNKAVYTSVRQLINPLVEPLKFIEKYGYEIIEVLCKTDLFFAAEPKVNDFSGSGFLELEALSTIENSNTTQQYLTLRKQYNSNEISNCYFNAENGKTVRFRSANCMVASIDFEFYSDFIISRNQAQAWKLIDNFALTTEENEAFTRLEPLPDTNPVHGAWLRYNEKAYVNIDNYKHRWQHSAQNPLDRDILTVVEKYIILSNEQPNPKAYETIDFNFAPTGTDPFVDIHTDPPEPGATQVSNLEILNIAALDYHIARMLGLGHLDIKSDVLGKEFIYIAEYYTNKNLDMGASDKSYQLLSMSLPVSTDIERLSLPVDLLKLGKGMEGNNPNSSNLYNSEGYSHDGKFRYISIYNTQIPNNEINPVFFSSYNKFDASSFTVPVYAGLEHRIVVPGGTDDFVWIKPELCHDTQYFNIDSTVAITQAQETLPLQIPDTYSPLFMHKQDKSGTYFYKGYGINWFSRAQLGNEELSIVTEIKPFNRLLPPSGINAFTIQKEFPLTFTSLEEQQRLQAIGDPDDKTLIRLIFDYYSYQDMITYSIPFDSPLNDQDYITDPNSIFPDDKEIFADEIEVFFRNYEPKTISAQIRPAINSIVPHPTNQLLAIIKTQDYIVPSSGATLPSGSPAQPSIPVQTFKSEIPPGTTSSDFIGGIFLMDGDSYIIHEITQDSEGLVFTVFKKAPSEAIISGQNPVIDQVSLVLPTVNPATEGLFAVTENMQNTSTWGIKNPNSLKVKIGAVDWAINREVFEVPQSSGTSQRYLEKSRGIWKNARIERHFEKLYKYQNSQGTIIDFPTTDPPVFQGVFKITFSGFTLNQHPQYNGNSHSVEWEKGFVRLLLNEDYSSGYFNSRTLFKVVKTEGIGTGTDLILYIYDENFKIEEDPSYNPILYQDTPNIPALPGEPKLSDSIKVNYYPSYKVYLYKNVANNLIQDAILPSQDEDVRYSIFGLKSVDNDNFDMQGSKYKSKFSVPAVMFANRIIEPKQPKQPIGSQYATRPDKFGKSTYSFITEYFHKPYSVQFFRANNSLLLSALYESETIEGIKEALNVLGGNDEVFFNNRWINFVDFDMLINGGEEYQVWPDEGDIQYQLPLPDNKQFFASINTFITAHNNHYNLNPGCPLIPESERGNVKFNAEIIQDIPNVSNALNFGHFVKETMFNCFLPLTEVPIIYQQIKTLDLSGSAGHRPINKKQNIRDASGYLLPTTHVDFDMAPMAAIYSQVPSHSTLFTDFTLDGASDNFYFYGVRELGNQMQIGEFSTFLGPIKLVNTNPAEPAKIMSLLPVVDNVTLGITAKVRIEINPYPQVQLINKIAIYRATNRLDAESILSMKQIKTVDIADIEVDSANGSWVVYDEFEDLGYKPYGDLLFYRIVVSRKVEYSITDYNVIPPASQVIVEQAPSLPSKVVVSTLVENYNPPTPELGYHSEPVISDVINWVILSWDQVCYKGKYHLYKLSTQGNWKEIGRIHTDDKEISKWHLYLLEEDGVTGSSDWVLKETLGLTGNEFYLPVEKLNLDPMPIKNEEGNILYHHFKIIAENTSNMFSTEEKILTIYKEETWSDIGGISSDGIDGMILQGTFIVRPN